MSALAFPKPRDQKTRKKPAFKVMQDLREICDLTTLAGRMEYSRRLDEMWERQKSMCGLQISTHCTKYIPRVRATYDHSGGRGLNGSHRDDRIWLGNVPQNMMVCSWCNALKASKRLENL